MKFSINYYTELRPEIEVIIKPMTSYSYLIYCSFYERYKYHCQGSDGRGFQFYFGNEDKILFDISFYTENDYFIIENLSKITFHAIIIKYEKYCEILEG